VKAAAALVLLCACTAQHPAPPATVAAPAPIAAPAPAATVLIIPEVVVMGERPKPKRAPRYEAEPEAVHERVFCDRWPSGGVICDSYEY
jgi:hypothetical protein